MITTREAMHLAPALAALDRGHDLLLEKTIARFGRGSRVAGGAVRAVSLDTWPGRAPPLG